MAWTASKIFVATIEDMLENTTALDLNSDTWNITLWDNDVVPSQTVTSANTAYGADQWVSAGNEVYDGAEWPQAGQALGSVTFLTASNVLTFDAANEVSDGTSATLLNVYGSMIYNATVAAPVNDQGLCYFYFGGVNSVTDGTLTVNFHANGIFTLTL
jgi:hypothetical protein